MEESGAIRSLASETEILRRFTPQNDKGRWRHLQRERAIALAFALIGPYLVI